MDIDGIRATARAEVSAQWDALANLPFRDQWRALARIPSVQQILTVPRSQRATGVVRAVATIEGLGAVLPGGLCYALTSQIFGIQYPLCSVLREEQCSDLHAVAEGAVLLCHALTEETGGSDPLSMTTRAERTSGGGFVLQGRKSFITAAPVADRALVFARTDEGRTPFALSAFVVDLHAQGVSVSEPLNKTVVTEVPMGVIEFDAVDLPEAALVGSEGAGLPILSVTTVWERALLFSHALGAMSETLDRTIEWAKTRRQFDRQMGASHLVAARIADMSTAHYRAREMVYRLAERIDAGDRIREIGTAAAMTKISVAEDYATFMRAAAELGGVRSFISDSGSHVDVASPVAASVYAGSNDLLRIGIARDHGVPVGN